MSGHTPTAREVVRDALLQAASYFPKYDGHGSVRLDFDANALRKIHRAFNLAADAMVALDVLDADGGLLLACGALRHELRNVVRPGSSGVVDAVVLQADAAIAKARGGK